MLADRQTHRQTNWSQYSAPLPGRSNNALQILIQHERASFLTPAVVCGRRPFRLKFALKVTHPFFEIRRLRQISAYNVSTAIDSDRSSIMTNRKSTTSFPTSYRWSAYVPPKSNKGGSKSDLLKIKFNFNRIKSAAKFDCTKTWSGKLICGITV